MQEALKNPHYKKIWEKVIMNRHPEVKSLEEALEVEEKHKLHCEVLFRYEDITEIINIEKQDLINVKIIEQAQKNGVAEFKTLGKPITLEDILILFGKTFSQTLNAYKFVQLTCEGAFITMQPIEHPLHRIEVILGKPLHEQPPETWEKIANLID